MGKEMAVGLDEVFKLFEEHLSMADISAARYLGKISAAIAKKRLEMGLSQKEFAEFLHVSQGMISKWESGDYNFTIRGLAELSESLDMELYVNFKEYREIVINKDDNYRSCKDPNSGAYGNGKIVVFPTQNARQWKQITTVNTEYMEM